MLRLLRRAILAIIGSALLGLPAASVQAAPSCDFTLGFATLRGMIPDQVGACLENEGHNPHNGDGLQHTTGGLLVWRKADNWTAFTDGYRTWINGPVGLVERLNTQRFPWEADAPADSRFAVIMTSDAGGVEHALDALRTSWFIGTAPAALDYAPHHVLTADTDVANLAALARRYPGRTWSLDNEPNGISMASADAQPAAYAQRLHLVATALHNADPTARLIGPGVLNWSANCNGCGGMSTGLAWTEAMRAAYVSAYGEDVPFDVWTIHTYPLDWERLPTVNYQLMEQQLQGLRGYLDSIPAQRGKPIWDTELGVHWGYTGYQFSLVDGQRELMPAGELRADLVERYFREMLSWLQQNGPQYNITRWFVFSTYNPDAPGDHAGAISLLNGAGADADLTTYGQIFVAGAGR